MSKKTPDTMLDEAIAAGLFPGMTWDGSEWIVYFSEKDQRRAWGDLDKNLSRAIKKTYYHWKDIYFDEDVD